jgi:hypothetical protein
MKNSFYSLCVLSIFPLFDLVLQDQFWVLIFGPVHATQIRLSDSSLYFLVVLGESSVPARFFCSLIFLAAVAFIAKSSAPAPSSPCLHFVFSQIQWPLPLEIFILAPLFLFREWFVTDGPKSCLGFAISVSGPCAKARS